MLYFAYGSCMNFQDLSRTVKAEFVTVARLPGWRLVFDLYSPVRSGGVADIVQDDESFVEGVIWKVPDTLALDEREHHPDVYRRFNTSVVEPSGRVWDVFTYQVVDKDEMEYQPTDLYAGLIWLAAQERLSSEYCRVLRGKFESLGVDVDSLFAPRSKSI